MLTPQNVSAVETELISLAGYTLGDLRADRSRELVEAIRLVVSQVERPRANLGSSGPPGRAD